MTSFWEQHSDRDGFLPQKTFIMKSELSKWLKRNPREQLDTTRSSDISGNAIMRDRSMMRKLTVTPQAVYETPHTNTTRLIQPRRPTHEPPISPTPTCLFYWTCYRNKQRRFPSRQPMRDQKGRAAAHLSLLAAPGFVGLLWTQWLAVHSALRLAAIAIKTSTAIKTERQSR